VASEALDIVQRELQRLRTPSKPNATGVFILCPFPEHNDSLPSLGVYLLDNGKYPVGSFHCMGCGQKGHWNKLARVAGLDEIPNSAFKTDSTAVAEAEMLRRRQSLLSKGRARLPEGVPWSGIWRTIRGRIVRKVGGIRADDKWGSPRLYLPITVRGQTIAVIRAALSKEKISYLIEPPNAPVKSHGLFPYDYVEGMLATRDYTAFVIVEGPRDALKLLDKGIPAISILGTNAWGESKMKLIERLCVRHNVEVVLMMDGDIKKGNGLRPGTEAQKKLYADLKKRVSVQQVKLWVHAKKLGVAELDPATLPKSMYRRLNQRVHK